MKVIHAIMKLAQSICGFLIFVAVVNSWLLLLPFINRISIYNHRNEYHSAVFVVTNADYDCDPDTTTYWLNGIVENQIERYIPSDLPSDAKIRSADDLIKLYPTGTKINVQYNGRQSQTISQKETLRVLTDRPNFWDEEKRLGDKLGKIVIIPPLVLLATYLLLRYLNNRMSLMTLKADQTKPS